MKRWNTENSKKKWGFKFGILKKGQNAKLALFLVKKPGNPAYDDGWEKEKFVLLVGLYPYPPSDP